MVKFTNKDLKAKIQKMVIDKIRKVRGKNTDLTVVCEPIVYGKDKLLYSETLNVFVCKASIDMKMTDRGTVEQMFSFIGDNESGMVYEIHRLSEFR